MEGKAKFVFPVLATAIIVFVASAAVTYANIGPRPDFVRRWLFAFTVGWPVAAVTAYIALPLVRRATARIVALIEGKWRLIFSRRGEFDAAIPRRCARPPVDRS